MEFSEKKNAQIFNTIQRFAMVEHLVNSSNRAANLNFNRFKIKIWLNFHSTNILVLVDNKSLIISLSIN